MLKRLNIGTKILIAFVSIAIVAVVVVGVVSYQIGSATLETESFNKLTAVREMKAGQIEDYFQEIINQAITLSEDRMIIDAMRAFDEGLHTIDTELGITDLDRERIDADLRRYYEEEFLQRLIPNLEEEASVSDYWPEDEEARLMQGIYIADNPYSTGSKHFLDDPGDGSSYSQAHKLYHPIIRDFLERFGYYDIFLVDADTGGHISYSVFKEVDYGTSLLDGPYAETNFAEAYRAARGANDPSFVQLVDFEPYVPSYNAPAAFIASPIFDGDEKIGVLVFQMPIDRINNIMTSNRNWSDVGLGESGETYIVGQDFRLRNQSRFLIEDSDNYFRMIEEIGVPLETRSKIRSLDSTIGLQEVKTEGTKAALSGLAGAAIFPDYRGVPVLSAYKPLDIPGMNWAIMSEIDQAEAFGAIRALGLRILGVVAALIVGIVVLAVAFSRTITRPLEELTTTADELATGNLDVEVSCTDQGDEIGVLACSFDSMRVSMKDLIENLEDRVDERTAELERATERVRSIIENASDAIITIDSDQNVVLFNPAAEKTFGYTEAEVAGQPLTMLMVQESRAIHPQEVNKFRNEPKMSRGMDVRRAIHGQRKDGTSFPAEAGISKMVLHGETFFTAFLRDITERVEAQEKLDKANKAIADQLAFTQTLMDAIPNPIFAKGTDMRYLTFNRAYEEAYGVQREDWIGKSVMDVEHLSPDQRERLRQQDADHLRTGGLIEEELDVTFADGEVHSILQWVTTFEQSDGATGGLLGITADITERKRMEAELEESELRSRSIVELASDTIIVLDTEQRILLWNQAAKETFGYSEDEIVGQGLHAIVPMQFRDSHDEAFHRASQAKGLAKPGVAHELVGLHREGHEIPIELSLSYYEVGDEGFFSAIIRDVTQRRRAAQQIQQQKEMLENTIESLTHPFYVINAEDYSIQLANSAAERLADAGISTCYALTHRTDTPCDSREDPCPLVEVKRTKKPFTVEHIHYDAGGNPTYAEVHGYPVFDEAGSVVQMIEYSLDITERKRLEMELERANERMSVELNFAREIQIGMLPLIFPAFPQRKEVDLRATLQSAREVGGDFYDFYFLDDDHLCFIIADVSGKGAPGALLMAVSKTLIKSRAADDHEPASILTHVNDELSRDNESAMFVTAFLAILDVRTGEFRYTNAGHNPPYIKRADGSVEIIDAFHGPVIGALPGMTYGQDSTVLDTNDMILLYTDGVTEAMDEAEALYTDERLAVLLEAKHLTSPEIVVEGTLSDVLAHQGDAEQADDITILVVQYTGRPEEIAQDRLSLKIKNDYAEMAVVEEKFHEFALKNEIPDAVRQPISIVLDEMLNNIVSYAYDDEEEHEIDIQIERSGNRLVLTIKDDGVPFNPFGRGAPDTSLSVEDREIGGLGIHLVRNMMDEYLYQRHINKNVVTLVKMIEE